MVYLVHDVNRVSSTGTPIILIAHMCAVVVGGGADGDEGGEGKGCLLTLSWRKETIVSLTLYAFYKKWGKREDSISHEPLPPRLRQPLKKGSHNVKCRTTVY